MHRTSKIKKVVGVFGRILSYLFFMVGIFALVVSISIKKDRDGAANLLGWQLRIVQSDSMEECADTDVRQYEIKDIPVKSLLLIELVPTDETEANEWYAKLKKGDVLTFRYMYVGQETITHRLVEAPIRKEGGYILHLEGDNKSSNGKTLTQTIDTSQTDSPNYVIGKVTHTSYIAGRVLVALQSPLGIVCILILPCLLIMGIEMYRLCFGLFQKRRYEFEEIEREQREEIIGLQEEIQSLQEQLGIREHEQVLDMWIEYDD